MSTPSLGILILVVVLGGLGAFLPRLQFDNSVDAFFLEDDVVLDDYRRFRNTFESDEFVLVLLERDAPWTNEFLGQLRSLVDELKQVEHVLDVTTITNVRYIEGVDDDLVVGDFLATDKTYTPDELAAKKETAIHHPYYRDFYVSNDGKHIGVMAKTAVIEGSFEYKQKLTTDVRAIIAKAPYKDWNTRAVGAPIVDSDVRVITERESTVFGGLVFLLIATGFLVVFRSVIGVVLPLLVAVLSMIGTFGLLGLIGAKINILTPIIPSFMLSVGVGTAVYLLTEIYDEVRQGHSVADSIKKAVRMSGVASAMSVLTTAGGLIAFSSSKIRPIQEVGLAMGVGLLMSFLFTIVLIPIIAGRVLKVKRSEKREQILYGRVETLGKIAHLVGHHYKLIVVIFAGLAAVAAVGAMDLRADYYYQGLFKEHTQIRQDYDAADAALGSSSSIELTIHTKEENGIKNPVLMAKIDTFEREIEAKYQESLGAKTYSLVDVVKEIGQALGEGKPENYKLPDSRQGVSQSIFLFEESGNDELESLVTKKYDEARVTISLRSLPDSHYGPIFADIDKFSKELGVLEGANATVMVTGVRYMWSQINDYLEQSQLNALAICTAVVMLVLMFMFQSVILGFVMTLVNMLSILFTLGLMGWAGIDLDPYTILIASIALGILDDDTIHNVRRTLYEYHQGKTIIEAVHASHVSAGQAMFYTSATIALAFSIYMGSDMASLAKFGLLVAFTIVTGGIVDFFLTPSVMIILEPFLLRKKRRAAS